jgi:hypothetical protein
MSMGSDFETFQLYRKVDRNAIEEKLEVSFPFIKEGGKIKGSFIYTRMDLKKMSLPKEQRVLDVFKQQDIEITIPKGEKQ